MRQTVENCNQADALSPSRRARKLLGETRLADLCGLTVGAIRKWDRRRSKGGKGGLIPCEYQARVLREAEVRGLSLKAEDLIAEPVQ